mgnify:CR=1 FL=1
MNLFNELNELCKKLSQSIKLMERYGIEKAEAERDYKICLNQWALKLKEDNLAVTLIQLIVKGVPEVAKKRFKRDVADVMYETTKQSIYVQTMQTKILETQLKLEYNEKI